MPFSITWPTLNHFYIEHTELESRWHPPKTTVDTASLNTDLAVRLARRERTITCITDAELLASSHERTDWCQIAAAASLHALPSAS